MQKLKKLMCLVLSVIMLLSINVPTFALDIAKTARETANTSATENGLKIEVATDKGSYSATATAKVTVTVTNTSENAIENVSAEALFDGLTPVGKGSQTKAETKKLNAGESISFGYSAMVNKGHGGLNFFQKIIMFFKYLFSRKVSFGNNGFDDGREYTEDSANIKFGKIETKNTVKVWYGKNGSTKPTDNPTYEELIKDVDIDEVYETNEKNVVEDKETGIIYVNNILFIDFDWDCTEERKAEIINSIDGKVVGGIDGYNELHVEIPAVSSLEKLQEIIDNLNKNEDVFADYDKFYDIGYSSEPCISDPFNNGLEDSQVKWDISLNNLNTSYNNWWAVATNMRNAWGYDDYFTNINIGVSDGGFDTSHEDLKISIASKEKTSNNHGTHVAGLIGATHNDKGIAGVVKNCSLYGYDLTNAEGEFNQSGGFLGFGKSQKKNILKSLEVLVSDKKCKIINFSIGQIAYANNGKYYYEESCKNECTDEEINSDAKAFSERIAKLLESKDNNDFLVVMAAGNGTKNERLGINAKYSSYFAAITEENCYSNKKTSKQEILDRIIIVGNAYMPKNGKFELWESSNGGPTVKIAAPGTNIYSTVAGIDGEKYTHMTGTSMASPIVAGIAGLVWSVDKKLTGAQVKHIILDTAKQGNITVRDNPKSPTTGNPYLVNAKLAVERAMMMTYDTCVVKGSIVDEDGNALSGVNIVATNKETGKKVCALNNSDGTYSLLLTTGTYNIVFSKYGTDIVVDTNKLKKGEILDLGEDCLFIGNSVVNGTVIDKKTGEPVSGATVKFIYNDSDTGAYDLTITTDEKGCFNKSVRRGNYNCVIEHPDYDVKELTVEFSQAKTDLGNIKLSVKGSDDDSGDGEDERPVTASGDCGGYSDSVKWTLYDDGELVISGEGSIPDYTSSDGAPWSSYKDKIISVVIKFGITAIGDYAFYNYEYLKTVSIDEGVTGIGRETFNSCYSLTKIELPNSLLGIDRDAFEYCKSLTDITIPNKVITIGIGAFAFCSGLKTIAIGNSVKEIRSSAFYNCENLESVIIPDSVTYIGAWAFLYCTSLRTVKIGNGLTKIPNSMFSDCKSIENLIIGNKVETIGADAFMRCTSIKSLVIPNSVKKIRDHAFYYCTSLSKISVPDSVTSIEYDAFGRTAIYNNSANWEDGVLYLGKHFAKADLSISGSYEIKEGTLTILDYAFCDCANLTNVTIPNSVTTIRSGAFRDCINLTNITIPDSVTIIDNSAFYGCENLTNITIPDSVTSIGGTAFYVCKNLTNITIPDSVTIINNSAFYGCENLTNITIPNSVTEIRDSAFEHCVSLIEITIPDSVTEIDYNAFNDCSNLKKITINNPNCEIDDDDINIFAEQTISDTATIYGYKGSTAEAYAKKYNRNFVAID